MKREVVVVSGARHSAPGAFWRAYGRREVRRHIARLVDGSISPLLACDCGERCAAVRYHPGAAGRVGTRIASSGCAPIAQGYFKEQILPVTLNAKGGATVFDTDEHVRLGATPDDFTRLKGLLVAVKSIHELQRVDGRYALATICIGGGQGVAAIFERM